MKFWLNRTLKILVFIFLLAWGFDRLYPLKMDRLQDPSHVVLDKNNELLAVLLAKDERYRLPIALAEVDPKFIRMLIAYEDKRFFYHPGVDPLALMRAIWQWGKNGRVISGGSTLTLQTVRLLEPRTRTLSHKLIEFLRALQLECHYSKKEILAIYLNLAPYGGNLEGLKTATLAYFAKDPKQLSIAESALLVVLPQKPSRLRLDLYPERARLNRDKVIFRLQKLGILTEQESLEAREDKSPKTKIPFPRHAPHLAYYLAEKEQKKSVHSTYIHKTIQKQIEALLKLQLPLLDDAQSMAVFVVDNKTRHVVAYVGSADYIDGRRCGYVDMIRATRSPGSALKPFIYGLGFEL